GPTTLGVGQTAGYSIRVVAPSQAQELAGVDVATSAGSLQAHTVQNPTRVLNGEIVQSSPAGPFSTLDFSFDLIAPATAGTVTLFGAGLSADGNGSTTGDGSA